MRAEFIMNTTSTGRHCTHVTYCVPPTVVPELFVYNKLLAVVLVVPIVIAGWLELPIALVVVVGIVLDTGVFLM